MFASMAALRLPHAGPASAADALRLHDALLDQQRIEVPVQVIDGALTIRLSAQVYNEPGDFARLAEELHALAEIPAAGNADACASSLTATF